MLTRILLAVFFAAQLLAQTPYGGITRVKPAIQVHTDDPCQCTRLNAIQVASGNISDDLFGVSDTRTNTWGFTDSFSTPIVFSPPAGYAVRILRIEGDLSGMPKHLSGSPVVPNVYAGLLVGFSSDASNAAGCNLCSGNTPQYRQVFVADGSTFHAPFTYDYGPGFLLGADNILNCIGASFLNTIGVPIHTEITYTFWYSFEPINAQE